MKKISIALAITVILIGILFFNNKFQVNQEVITFSDDTYLIVEDILIEFGNPVIEIDETIYFSYDIIKEYIDEDLFYDENESMVIFTNEKYVKRYSINEKIASINSKQYFIENPLVRIDKTIYIPIEVFIKDYDIEINYFEDTNAVVLDYTDMVYLEAEVILDKPVIRSNLSNKSPIIASNLEKGHILNVYGEYEDWLKIRTKDGIPGFIEKEYLKLLHIKDKYKSDLISRDVDDSIPGDKINLTWDYTYAKVKFTDKISPIHGVNVISPTWFSILDEEGNIQDKGNKDYVRKYKELGMDIWALVDNSFDPDLTHEILKSSKSREIVISKLLDIYLDYGFNGINIDFENIHMEDRDLLTQFVRELYPIFKENELVVTMDITTISTSEKWSLCYDRSRLEESVDYLVLMAYDQHWASSPIAGSVAEYSWVENGLANVLKEVSNKKLILAIPLYTRLWSIEKSQVSSRSLSMSGANKFISDNSIEPVWIEDAGQYYGEVEKEDILYQIWLEEELSLNQKISLIHKYSLAGVASWRKGYETSNIWESIDNSLN